MEIAEILTALFAPIKHYERAGMQAAADNWPEVGPVLIARVTDAAAALRADPASSDESMGLIYALTLFGHLRDESAWPAVVALCTLPAAVADNELGGLATEDLGQILYRCSGRNANALTALYANSAVDQWIRGAALRALHYGVAEGVVARSTLLDCLIQTLQSPRLPDAEDWAVADHARHDFLAMRPFEHAELARQLAAAEVIDADDFDEDIESLLREDPVAWAELQQSWRDELARYEPQDLHARMAWWAAFEENRRPPNVGRGPTFDPIDAQSSSRGHGFDAAKAAKRKQKNKMAQKSRKANRKKK